MSQRVLGRQFDSGDAKMNRLVTEAIPHPLGLRMMASRPTSSGHHHIRYFPLPQVEGRVSAVKRTCDESYCSPYYEPAHWGLEIVGVVECDLSYEFDMFVIWTDGHRYYWASDAGCSCPVPFEDTELLKGTARDALIDLEAWVGEEREWDNGLRKEAYEEAAKSDWLAALKRRSGDA